MLLLSQPFSSTTYIEQLLSDNARKATEKMSGTIDDDLEQADVSKVSPMMLSRI
jgi:hypothetical protein